MRPFSLAIAVLVGSAAANPAYGYHPYGNYESGPVSSSTPSSIGLSTGGNSYPSKSNDYPHPPLSTGGSKPPYSSGAPPHPTSDTITTYTTETVCPVTKTYGSEVVTTLTTSTITITSCKGGCHHRPTPTPYNPHAPVTETETITSTAYTWVPRSSPIGTNGPSVVYSTYLTASYYTTTYVTEHVHTPTGAPNEYTPVVTPPVVTAVDVPSECPTPATITHTVTIYPGHPGNPQPCHYCQTKTLTITEGGYAHTVTVTITPSDIPTYNPLPPSSTPYGPKPPISTGANGGSYIPSGTGNVPYPTHGYHTSSIPYSSGNVGPQPTGYGH